MPPRLPSGTAALETALSHTCLSSTSACTATRAFSSTPTLKGTAQRRWKMHQWLKGRGGAIWDSEAQAADQGPRLAGPMTNQPFPLNPMFKSEPVLSEELREKIYEKITGKDSHGKQAYLAVSQELGIDVRRVAAVVRLMAVEKQMIAKDQPLATPYANILKTWLPQTPLNKDNPEDITPHEPINEITVHPSTQKQLFVPASESRTFTREDAAKAFHDHLLSADDRSFQKSLIAVEREIHEKGTARDVAIGEFEEAERLAEVEREQIRRQRERKAKRKVKVLPGARADVRIRDVATTDVGKDGRKPGAVGWRYGVPHMDRKRGAVKIPTEVPSQRTAPQQ